MKGLYFIYFVLVLSVTCLGSTLYIDKYIDFAELAEKGERGEFPDTVHLRIDLDFSNDILKNVVDKLPLGVNSASECNLFSGTFDGGNNTVKNLKLLDKGSSGLFCCAGDAVIKNLVIDETCKFSGDTVGAVAVNASGSITVDNVFVYGSINVKKNIGGGLIGSVYGLTDSSIIVKNSGFQGAISGNSFDQNACYQYGGIIGAVSSCSNSNFLFTKNVNNVTMDASFTFDGKTNAKKYGGFVGQFENNEKVDVVVSDNINEVFLINTMSTDCDQNHVGGMFGYVSGTGISMTIENNLNKAKLRVSTSGLLYVGGVIGNLYSPNNLTLAIKKNINNCDMVVSANHHDTHFGGFVGYATLYSTSSTFFESNIDNDKIQIENLMDHNSVYYGGLFGFWNCERLNPFHIYNNTNNGNINVESPRANMFVIGGLGGRLYVTGSGSDSQLRFWDNINNGNLNGAGSCEVQLGGIVGRAYIPYQTKFSFDNNANYGHLHLKDSASSGAWSVGGIVGYLYNPTSGFVCETYVMNNINEGEIETRGRSYCYLGGIVGYYYDDSVKVGHIINNTNTGNINSYDGASYQVGGFVGYLGITASNILFSNNKNEGRIQTKCNTSSNYAGGMVGYSYMSSTADVIIKDNLNSGYLRVTGISGFYDGGLFGFITVPNSDTVIVLKNNSNKGSISVEYHTSNSRMVAIKSDSYGYVAGLVGCFSEKMFVVDSANYGNIINSVDSAQVETCGLVCSSFSTAQIIIQNSVNTAAVQGGGSVYGISYVISGADNVVSVGVVSGSENCYSFWKSATEVPTSIYGLSDKCMNCDGNVTLIAKDSKDGKYYTVSGDKALVDSLLNAEAEKNGYTKRWGHNLSLETLFKIHIGKPINKDLDVLSGTTLEEISVLKEYLESKEHAVGDINSNKLLNEKSEVTEGMNIIVMERHAVAIDMEEGKVLAVDVDISELAKSIGVLAGIDVSNILIDLEVDGKGFVIRVIVILSSEELSGKVVSAVNNLVKDGQCAFGVLCHAQKAYIIVDDNFISGSESLSYPHFIIALVMMMFMKMM